MKPSHLILVGLACGATVAYTLKSRNGVTEKATPEERKHSYYRTQTSGRDFAKTDLKSSSAPAYASLPPALTKISQQGKRVELPVPKTQQSPRPQRLERKLKPPEVQAVTTFMKEIKRAIGSPSAADDFYRELEGLGLRPRKSTSSSESTGDLITVRARATLPGVRYFHAQFVADGDGSAPTAQHISFEIRPSADGMSIAKKMAQEMFQLNIPPTVENENYVEWNRNGRTLWIKKFTEINDLKEDLFNARDKNDLGLVMVTLELDPHAHQKGE